MYAHVHHVPVLASVVTSMFMHGSWEHVLGNMLFLWIFGNNIEDRVGRRRFLVFYLLGGLAGGAARSSCPGPGSDVPNIGASGAIAAVLGGYLMLYPRAAVITYIPPIFLFPLPAVLFLVGWIVLQIYAVGTVQVGSAGGGVAYYAHIGGFVFGLLNDPLVGAPERGPRPAPGGMARIGDRLPDNLRGCSICATTRSRGRDSSGCARAARPAPGASRPRRWPTTAAAASCSRSRSRTSTRPRPSSCAPPTRTRCSR